MNGIIIIDKPMGLTSHDVCNKVRKILNTKKVGHTGTLDPNATGVMGVLLGSATRLSEYISSGEKEYIGEISFGKMTDTLDIWGEVLEEGKKNFTKEAFQRAVKSFIGKTNQTPPIYSALKVNGKPLYKYAREGKEVTINQREIEIYKLEILEEELPNKATLLVNCSKGTYIRSLFRDIGMKIGALSIMSGLRRTKSSNMLIEDSVTLEGLEEIYKSGRLNEILLPMDFCIKNLNEVHVKEESLKFLLNGNLLNNRNLITNTENLKENEVVRIYFKEALYAIGVVKADDNNVLNIQPKKILIKE